MFSSRQLSLFEEVPKNGHIEVESRSGTFVDNMKLPVHRWFRYSAGFSAEWVRSVIAARKGDEKEYHVLDPFAGVATTLLACNAEGVRGTGFEMHPFVIRIAEAKLRSGSVDVDCLKTVLSDFYFTVKDSQPSIPSNLPALLQKCYTSEALAQLMGMRELYLSDYESDSTESTLLWLTITAILRMTSSVGTAQWQYILPNKRKAVIQHPMEAFRTKAQEIVEDILFVQRLDWRNDSVVYYADSRQPGLERFESADMVITSPPYPNNYDYADATRLEMTFWGEIERWSDLHPAVRNQLVRSCSQHTAAERLDLDTLLDDERLLPVLPELSAACNELASVRLTKGGKKTYHTMAAAYFIDMAQTLNVLRKFTHSDSEMCFVIGDSAPYGVYLHVDQWLGELALAAGFRSFRFEKIRDRNTKWKNRKHTVPLKEGRLWIQG